MLIIRNILLTCLVFTPIYLLLAVYSLRYYASMDSASEYAIESFMSRIKQPLRSVYAEHSKFNVFTKDPNINIATYLKTDRDPLILARRIYFGLIPFAFLAAICIGFTKQTESFWQLEYASLFIIHATCTIWAWRFGSKLSEIENSPN